MAIRAVVFDIGGVLEITPDLGVTRQWETRLGLSAGELDERMHDAWRGGSIGTITLDDVHQALRHRLGLDERQLAAFMADLWREYLGTPNTELIDYAARLRPRYRTGIVSNSFVGARQREQQAYGFEDLVDEIVYSHEAGMSKPDPRIYALACARLDVRPQETVFLDDSDVCVAGARKAGMHAIRYQDNAQAIAEIEGLLSSGMLIAPTRNSRPISVVDSGLAVDRWRPGDVPLLAEFPAVSPGGARSIADRPVRPPGAPGGRGPRIDALPGRPAPGINDIADFGHAATAAYSGTLTQHHQTTAKPESTTITGRIRSVRGNTRAGVSQRDTWCLADAPGQPALAMVSSMAACTSPGRSMCGMCPAPSTW
jgi:epoxide hydrolase-like predicted phosphatase